MGSFLLSRTARTSLSVILIAFSHQLLFFQYRHYAAFSCILQEHFALLPQKKKRGMNKKRTAPKVQIGLTITHSRRTLLTHTSQVKRIYEITGGTLTQFLIIPFPCEGLAME